MRIRLKADVDIGKQHGLRKGRIFYVGRLITRGRAQIKGDSGASIKLHRHEFDIIDERNADAT